MNDGAYDDFHAGTIICYDSDRWETIKKFSGLWTSDGKLHQANLWESKLPRIAVHRRNAKKSSLQASQAC